MTEPRDLCYAEVAADTHAVIWFLEDGKRLTAAAGAPLDGAERIFLPSTCWVEIVYRVEKGQLQAAVLPRLFGELDNPATTLTLTTLDLGVVLALQDISRFDVSDLPGRVLAATALFHGAPLVTRDGKIRCCGVQTIW